MADKNLMIYNIETNEIGYIVPDLYLSHGSTYNYYSPRTMSLDANFKKVIGNLSFLANPDNKWVAVMSNSLIQHIKVEVEDARHTSPYFYFDSDVNKVFFCRDIAGNSSPGSITINCKETYRQWNGGWNEYTSHPAININSWCKPSYYAGQPGYYRSSVEVTSEEAASLMILIDSNVRAFSDFYVDKIWKNQRTYGSLPIIFVDSNYTASTTKYSYISVIAPCLASRGSFGINYGTWPSNNFNETTTWYKTTEPLDIVTHNNSVYYDSSIPTVLQNYINTFFSGEEPTYVGDVTEKLRPAESIYTPGGDTSEPYNPYPSGSSPYTDDPLGSGEETDSPNTDGTWELPFDAVSLDHARVDSSQAGVYRLVGLTQAQLKLMADYMFSDTSVTEAWENLMKLIYGNVVDTIIGIQEFPMDVADSVGTDIFCFIGRDTTTGMFVGKALTSEYRSLDFGSIPVPRYSGTFYDFEPYTTLTLYIPYVGYIDMKPTEVVGSTLYISGWVHLSTGEVTINVRSSRTGLLGSYSGNIGRSLPISSADSTRLYAAIIETAAGLGGYATFGAGISAMGGIEHADPHNMNVARGEYAQSVKAYGAAKRGVRGVQATMLEKQAAYEQAKEEFSSAKTAEKQQVQAAERAEREFNEAGLEAYSNAIDAVTSGFEVVRGTHMTPGAGRTSPQVCFLRIEVPHQNVSKNQKLLGYPCNSAEVLNSDKLHGYTELRMIDLQIPGITLTELQELESILKGGFYLP